MSESVWSRVKRHWADSYLNVHGVKYPWQSQDNKHFSNLMKLVGIEPGKDEINASNPALEDTAKRVMDVYLARTDKFYEGHMLRMLVFDYPKFVVADTIYKPKPTGEKKGEFEQKITLKRLC